MLNDFLASLPMSDQMLVFSVFTKSVKTSRIIHTCIWFALNNIKLGIALSYRRALPRRSVTIPQSIAPFSILGIELT